MYLEVPVRAIATGTPLRVPILIAPPTFAKAGTAFRSTDKRPPESFLTAGFAAAGTSASPKARTAQAPAKSDRRVIGSIFVPYFKLL
jgi:hypothetical protein